MSRLRSVDILIRRTFARLVWVISGGMATLGVIQFGIPSLPRSQGWISFGLAAALALLVLLLRKVRPTRATLDLFWLVAMTAVSASLALRVWVDPVPLRPFILLIALPMAGTFIHGRTATLLLWSSQIGLVLLGWGLAHPRIHRLAEARREIRALEGMIPICAHCKKVRNDKGYWEQVEGYLTRRKLALFSHGICPDCLEEVRREVASLTPPRSEAP
jgi:hypothetical protein